MNNLALEISVDQQVVTYLQKYGKNEAYLLNNRLYLMWINSSDLHKLQYNVNREYIKSH